MKALSTKSSVFNWSVLRSQPSDVLRLRGGTGSPSPSPPPTRPTSPTPETSALTSDPKAAAPEVAASSAKTVRSARTALAVRSRSNLRRSEDLSLSPVRRHTAPVKATDKPRSRRETFLEASHSESTSEAQQDASLVEKSKLTCSNCGKDFAYEKGRKEHENFYCPKKRQVNVIFIVDS